MAVVKLAFCNGGLSIYHLSAVVVSIIIIGEIVIN